MKVMAYTYDADYHCIDCTHLRFEGNEEDWVDLEGNPVHPVFDLDERFEPSEEIEQNLFCGD